MSNLGQAALIVVGTVVGAYFGYPQLGFVLGSLAGSALFPTQLPSGPKIQDNRTTTSVVGGPISILFGTANLPGTVMWLAPYVQHESTQGGKGGPEQQTFSYTQSIALGLAERVDDDAPDTEGAIAGVSRIWENGSIVYDIRPQQVADTALGTIAETDQQYHNRLVASAAYAETFTLYLGDELQEPDPTIEAIEGVGNVPPFRGVAYIVYPNRNLTIAQGLRHPNFQFECYSQGVGDCVTSTLNSTEVLHPWLGGGSSNPVNTLNTNLWVVDFMDGGVPPGMPVTFADEASMVATIVATGHYPASFQFLGYAYTGSGGNSEIIQSGGVYNFRQPSDGFYSQAQTSGGLIAPKNTAGAVWRAASGTDGSIQLGTGESTSSSPGPLIYPYTTVLGLYAATQWIQSIGDMLGFVQRTPGAPTPLCYGLPEAPNLPGYAIMTNGDLVKCNEWQAIFNPDFAPKCLQQFLSADPDCSYPLNPCVLNDDPNYASSTFWTAAYNHAVSEGLMPAGLTYGIDYPRGSQINGGGNSWYQVEQVICQGAGFQVSIGSIIRAVCKRSGLLTVDASDMDAINVDGYAVSAVCTGSSILSPLRSIGFFDCVETGGILKFAGRGKPVVATFTTDDFGAYDGNQSGENGSGASTCPPSITVARAQDEDLPRSIRFHYIATSRDYEDGEQDSIFRLATPAVNDVDITVPVAIPDQQAARCASVLWADAWAARTSYELSIDQSWLALDVGDCIAVPVDGFYVRMRVASDTNASAILRKLSCVKDDEGAYISFAVVEPPQRQPQELTFVAATIYELLDLPCLQDADSDPGFYVAAQGSSAGKWKGATFYKSIDSGATYNQLFSLVSDTLTATIDAPLPVTQAYTWDDSTTILITTPDESFAFESVTDDAMLNGANGAAVGADGRWEIIQYGIATQIGPTSWALSHLLRGRRGTEHVIGSSRANDALTVISQHTIGRVVLASSEIGAIRTYRGTSIGASFTSGTVENFAGHAQALVPFSPVHLAAHRLTDGDISISWLRRSRLGRTLMSGVDIPLGEATEAFSVDILSPDSPSSPEVVVRTIDVTGAEDVLYTVTMQEADFGSTPLSSIKVAIYQISAIVGRGTPAVQILEIS